VTAPDDPNQKPATSAETESGPYGIADDGADSTRRPRIEPKPDLSDSQDRDPSPSVSDEVADDESTDSLPPPISRHSNPQPWLVVAGVCAALLLISWLAGAPQLSIPDAKGNIPELGFGERLNGLARSVVFIPLATLAAGFGLGALAFVRQRPIGAIPPLFAKCTAIICLATLVWLVPSDGRMLKLTLNVIGFPLVAGALAIPVFRLHPRDAAFATAYGLLGMLLLVGSAWVVVWAAT
jgi:hypothetical protein